MVFDSFLGKNRFRAKGTFLCIFIVSMGACVFFLPFFFSPFPLKAKKMLASIQSQFR
jgi:hypothetical protein